MTEKVRLLDAHGAFVRMVDAAEARTFIRERLAEGLGTRKTIKAVRLIVNRKEVEHHGVPSRALLPNGMVGQRYSHDRATEDNPEQVWTLRKLSAGSVSANVHIHCCFVASVIDCLPEGQRRAEFLEYLKSLHADKIAGCVKSDLS